FALGPYGRPVSFESVQSHAMSLVWALEAQEIVKSYRSVAVVGAGLAGLTASVALLARDCYVSLYEKAETALATQQDAHHRFVHPTIHYWPKSLNCGTTRFPFLDWHMGSSAEIIKGLQDTWKRDYLPRISSRYFYTTVVKVAEKPGGKVAVRSTGLHT